jgi:hypothetical protein
MAAYLGAVAFGLVLVVGAPVMSTDRPLELTGRAAQWLLNKTVHRRSPREGLLTAVSAIGFDYLALLCALRAVGAKPQPSLVPSRTPPPSSR